MIIQVRVATNSAKPCVEKISNSEYKVRVCAKPVDGKANADVVRILAAYFGVPERQVRIVAGKTSKRKTIVVDGV